MRIDQTDASRIADRKAVRGDDRRMKRTSFRHRLVIRIAFCRDQLRIEVNATNIAQNETYVPGNTPFSSTYASFQLTRSSDAPSHRIWRQNKQESNAADNISTTIIISLPLSNQTTFLYHLSPDMASLRFSSLE